MDAGGMVWLIVLLATLVITGYAALLEERENRNRRIHHVGNRKVDREL